MCGILGYLSPKPKHEDWNFFLDALNLVEHRGPDGYGFWSPQQGQLILPRHETKSSAKQKFEAAFNGKNHQVLFGHRRLSILDLSESAFQPFGVASNGGTTQDIFLVHNGEIYNYLELRQELEAKGIRFRTTSDTEVVARAYEAWGERCFERFNGMWAIAIWDLRHKKLVLSRDRMGVKPLYYSFFDDSFCFSSEIKQLLFLRKNQKTQWNYYRLFEFIQSSQLHHSEETFFENIFCFPAGHVGTFTFDELQDQATFRRKVHRYWNFPEESNLLKKSDISFETAAKQLLNLLESSVSLRLRSDVPVGSALSGGLDSSTIVSLIAKLETKQQKAFSAIYPNDPISEESYAAEVVKGTRIEPVWIQPNHEDLVETLEKLLWHQDGPVVSTSMFAQWSVFQSARQHGVPVMLDGQGADEILGGYEGFWKPMLRSAFQQQNFFKATRQGLLFYNNHSSYFTLQRFLRKKQSSALDLFQPSVRSQITDKINQYAKDGDPYLFGQALPRYSDPLRQALYRSTTRSLPSLLTYEDRNSMAFSIESRTPFLDYRIVELCFSLPTEFHFKDGMRKSLLREATKGIIPERLRIRKDKVGFATPEKKWEAKIFSALSDKAFSKINPAIFEKQAVQKALQLPEKWRVLNTLLFQSRNLS